MRSKTLSRIRTGLPYRFGWQSQITLAGNAERGLNSKKLYPILMPHCNTFNTDSVIRTVDEYFMKPGNACADYRKVYGQVVARHVIFETSLFPGFIRDAA